MDKRFGFGAHFLLTSYNNGAVSYCKQLAASAQP
jgi:hypothetical protein